MSSETSSKLTSTPPLLELDCVSRQLGGREVLRELSFTLQRGEVLGLLGANGAGKSTTLAIIAGILSPSSGCVHVHGGTAAEAGQHIGWVPESVPLWPELTVIESLDACGRLRGIARDTRKSAIARELSRLDLGDFAHRLCGQLSLGQQRRVGLAQALLHEPGLLVLDEPGNGLDPVQTAQLRELIGLLAPGHGIILSSHDLAEVEAMCSRVLILHEGQMRCDAPLADIRGKLDARFRAIAKTPASVAA